MEEQEWLTDAYRPIESYMKSLQYRELIREIRKILPAQYWEVVCMRYFEGMPVHEIALRLNLSEEKRLFQAAPREGKGEKGIGR